MLRMMNISRSGSDNRPERDNNNEVSRQDVHLESPRAPRDATPAEENKQNSAGIHHSRSCFPQIEDANRVRRFRRRCFIACNGDMGSWLGMALTAFMNCAIFLSICSMMTASLPQYRQPGAGGTDVFDTIESVVVAIFVTEFMVRFFTVSATFDVDYVDKNIDGSNDAPVISVFGTVFQGVPALRALYKMFRFLWWPLTLVDIASFLPYFLSKSDDEGVSGTTVLRVLRIARALLLFKVTSRTDAFKILTRTIKSSLPALMFMLAYLIIMTIFFSAIVFFLEQGEWNEEQQAYMRPTVDGDSMEPTPFKSMLHAAYFVVVSMTTVGYGDMVATSPLGRILAGIILICGVLTLALPASIFTSRFPMEYALYERERKARVEKARQERRAIFAKLRIGSKRAPRITESPSIHPQLPDVGSRPARQDAAERPVLAEPTSGDNAEMACSIPVASVETGDPHNGDISNNAGSPLSPDLDSMSRTSSVTNGEFDDMPTNYDVMDKLRTLERANAQLYEQLSQINRSLAKIAKV